MSRQETNRKDQIVKYRECGWLICVHHKLKMHEGMTCAQKVNSRVLPSSMIKLSLTQDVERESNEIEAAKL